MVPVWKRSQPPNDISGKDRATQKDQRYRRAQFARCMKREEDDILQTVCDGPCEEIKHRVVRQKDRKKEK